MNRNVLVFSTLAVAMLAVAATSHASGYALKPGTVTLKSAGPLAFGPDGILIAGDPKAATLYAIDTGDKSGDPRKVKLNVEGLNGKVAKALGARKVQIGDLAVNPRSGNVYLSVSQSPGTGALVRVTADAKVEAVSLKDVAHSKIALPNPPADKVVRRGRRSSNARDDSITDLAYFEGKVLVAGLTAGDAPSTVREIPFPFLEAETGIKLEIFHGAHGRVENSAPVRTFVPFTIDGEPSLLAGFQCTPLVKFPVKALSAKKGKAVRGTTVAELGNRNRPLDMIVYKKDGKDFLLMANTTRGVMKISTAKIERPEGISRRVSGTAGQTYETIENLKGVVQLDKLNDNQAIVLVQTSGGSQNLQTIDLP